MKWVPGKKSALGDKPATRRHERPLTWERLPYATRLVLTSADADVQKKTVRISSSRYVLHGLTLSAQFLEIWNEDGVTAEPEEESGTE
jgi:cohesin loading factor subunit SCC2